MTYRTRIYYSAEQRKEIWDRWKRRESVNEIGRVPSPAVMRLSCPLITKPSILYFSTRM